MDPVTSTPSAPAATPAAAPASTPAATPSTSTPAAPATPVTTTPATPAAASTPAAAVAAAPAAATAADKFPPGWDPTKPLPRNQGETDIQFISRRTQASAEYKAQQAAGTLQAAPEAPKVDVKPVEEKPAEAKPEEKPAEAAALDPDSIPDEDLGLAEIGVVTPQELTKKLADNPELAAALEKSGMKDQLYKLTRVASESAQIKQIFPTPRAAEMARDRVLEYNGLEDSYLSIQKDPKNINGFIAGLAELSQVHDENGKPMIDGKGTPVTDGSFESFMESFLDVGLGGVLDHYTKIEDAEAVAAVKLLMERRSPASSKPSEDLPEHLQRREADLNSRAENLRRQEQDNAKQARQTGEQELGKQCRTHADSHIDRIFEKVTGLTDYAKDQAKREVFAAVVEALDKDPYYKSQRDYMAREAQTADLKKERVRWYTQNFNRHLMAVARPILQKAGAQAKAANQSVLTKIDAQKKASQAEPQSAGAAPVPQAAPSGAEALKKFREDFRAQYKRMPTTTEEVTWKVRQYSAARKA